ncbi:MAG: secondary thiamine-phosphate synthase enzyme YjbQ [Bacteroidota bacterium]
MVLQYSLTLPPFPRGFHLITHHIEQAIAEVRGAGVLHVFIQHTSAGLTINENADPDVRIDYETIFNKLVPENDPAYVHTIEGPDDIPAHVKSSLVGSSVSIPITNGRLNLGTWQGIYLCEFRNRGGARRLVLTVYS